jgi:hypothetical protein
MPRPVIQIRSGQYNALAGHSLVVAETAAGATLTLRDGPMTLVWHFGADGVFSHLSADLGVGHPLIADLRKAVLQEVYDDVQLQCAVAPISGDRSPTVVLYGVLDLLKDKMKQ